MTNIGRKMIDVARRCASEAFGFHCRSISYGHICLFVCDFKDIRFLSMRCQCMFAGNNGQVFTCAVCYRGQSNNEFSAR